VPKHQDSIAISWQSIPDFGIIIRDQLHVPAALLPGTHASIATGPQLRSGLGERRTSLPLPVIKLRLINNQLVDDFEVLIAVVMKSYIYWDAMLRSPIKVNRRFRETYRPDPITLLHDVISQEVELLKGPAALLAELLKHIGKDKVNLSLYLINYALRQKTRGSIVG
jgi:hypothetical protein